MLQDGQQSQLHVTDCLPEPSPLDALGAAAIIHIDDEAIRAEPLIVPTAPPSGWDELKELLSDLPFPSWMEQESAGVIFSNCCELVDYVIGDRAQREIRAALAGDLKSEPVSVRNRRGEWVEVSASVHPIPFPVEAAGALPSISLYVVCLPGQELLRDRAVIEALLRCLLGGTVPAALSSLTPQQRVIYRLLMRNHTYKEIAGHLGVAHATVRVQIAAMRKRLGADRIPLLRQA